MGGSSNNGSSAGARGGVVEIETAREALGEWAASSLTSVDAGRHARRRALGTAEPLVVAVAVGVAVGASRPVLMLIGVVVLVAGVAVGTSKRVFGGVPEAITVRTKVNERAGTAVDTGEEPVGKIAGFRRIASTGIRLALVAHLWSGAVVGVVVAFGGPLLETTHGTASATASLLVATALIVGGALALAAGPISVPRILPVSVVVAVTMVVAGQGWAATLTWTCLALTLTGATAAHIDLLARSFSAVPAALRTHLAGASAAAWMGGAVLGVAVDALVERRLGPAATIVCAAPAVLVAARCIATVSTALDIEASSVAAELVEDQQIRVLQAQGIPRPLLSCRHIDFAYGELQVLFDVSVDVDHGEMVALLGTNGAGKSTLLRAVSGLGRPTRGSVRLDGEDITTLSPERRVRRGIVQVPGGRATFHRLTVEENLLAYAYTLGIDRRRAAAQLAPVFDRFPQLSERRGKPASTLSGGEAQMLGLAKAILLQPRLLIVDELSLGLAPKIVGELLELVRTINATGTAVVLVEQSLNVALSLVDRAYFMEKGQVRFEGSAAGLLARDDLLRSVFLAGAEESLR